MECSKCNSKILPDDFECAVCNEKITSITYRNNSRFYLSIVISSIVICLITTFLIIGMNTFYLIFIILISIVLIIWGSVSYLTKFVLDKESITYYKPFMGITVMKWSDIDDFTVYKEDEQKKIFPKKIYTLTSEGSENVISFPEMKYTMSGYSRFMATIIGKTCIYPREIASS